MKIHKFIVYLLFLMLWTAVFEKILILIFHHKKKGQLIRALAPNNHHVKKGTPTIGGIIFPLIVCLGYGGWKLILKEEIQNFDFLVLFPFVGYAIIGLIDDLLSIKRQDNMGLDVKQKFLCELCLSAIFYWGYLSIGFNNQLYFFGPIIRCSFLYGILIIILMTGFTNATNFTDGIDGLLSLNSIISFLCIGEYAYLKNNQNIFYLCMIVSVCLISFLLFNLHKAQIFMGDTGSLAIGGLMVGILIILKSEVLIIFFGFIYFVEILSVVMQVWFFKRSKGNRIFKMAPLHHHFELLGFSENSICIIFSLFNLLFCVIGILIGVNFP